MNIWPNRIFLIPCLLATITAWAEGLVTEVIPLHQRAMSDMVHTLRPLVPAPGTVAGMDGKLVIRTTPSNLEEIRAVLAKLDRPPRRLLIAVRQGRWEDLRASLIEATGSVQAGDVTVSTGKDADPGRGLNVGVETDDSQANVRVWSTRPRDDEVGIQRIQATEGQEAFIQTGQSVPVGERVHAFGRVVDSIRYRDVTTGFLVTPRVTGDRVTLDINAFSDRLSAEGAGKIDVQQASTVVSGRLGEWILVGGSQEDGTFSDRGTVYSTRRNENVNRAILLRVTEIP